VQERLKQLGDWIEFPRTLDRVAALMRSGRLAGRPYPGNASASILLDGAPIEDLFLQYEETAEEQSEEQ
jgi:hypothetical protein